MTTKTGKLSLAQQIANKKQEIKNYEGVLERYRQDKGQARWYNYGVRSLENLHDELAALLKKQRPSKWGWKNRHRWLKMR